MAQTRANMSFIQAVNAAIKVNEIVQSQNIKLCEIGHENDLNDIDKEYINSNSFNLLNMLTMLMKMHNKSKLNPKAKNVKIVQRHVEKKNDMLC